MGECRFLSAARTPDGFAGGGRPSPFAGIDHAVARALEARTGIRDVARAEVTDRRSARGDLVLRAATGKHHERRNQELLLHIPKPPHTPMNGSWVN